MISHRGQQGFSLLEVVVALGILIVGVSSAISLFAAGTAAHSRAVDRVRSIEVCEVVFASLEGALRDGATLTQIINDPPWQPSLVRWPGIEVALEYGTIDKEEYTDLLLVEIHIRWISRGQEAQEVFHQLVPRMRSVRLERP